MESSSHSARPAASIGRTSQRGHSKFGGAPLAGEPSVKPYRASLPVCSVRTRCRSRATRIRPAGSLIQPVRKREPGVSMRATETDSSVIQTTKNRMLPPVRRSHGTRSNHTAIIEVKAKPGRLTSNAGLANSMRSTLRSSARRYCAIRPTASVNAVISANTTMWLAHFANRKPPRVIGVATSNCHTRVSMSRTSVPRTR